MIDTDKYEGHTPIRFWEVVGQGEPEETTDSWLATSMWHIPYWMSCNKAMMGNSKADRNLIQDAPLLLQEIKRLREAIADIAKNMQAADPSYLQGFIKDLLEVIE
tara:strand:- start:284 stop:598 length:315 start_codon:yes stop_codon:yes gene_type:complete